MFLGPLRTPWQKAAVEQSCSLHGGQKAERRRGHCQDIVFKWCPSRHPSRSDPTQSHSSQWLLGFGYISRSTLMRLETSGLSALRKFPHRHTQRCVLLIFLESANLVRSTVRITVTAIFQTLSKVPRGVLGPQLFTHVSPSCHAHWPHPAF